MTVSSEKELRCNIPYASNRELLTKHMLLASAKIINVQHTIIYSVEPKFVIVRNILHFSGADKHTSLPSVHCVDFIFSVVTSIIPDTDACIKCNALSYYLRHSTTASLSLSFPSGDCMPGCGSEAVQANIVLIQSVVLI